MSLDIVAAHRLDYIVILRKPSLHSVLSQVVTQIGKFSSTKSELQTLTSFEMFHYFRANNGGV